MRSILFAAALLASTAANAAPAMRSCTTDSDCQEAATKAFVTCYNEWNAKWANPKGSWKKDYNEWIAAIRKKNPNKSGYQHRLEAFAFFMTDCME